MKINDLGVIQWDKTFGGTLADYLYTIVKSHDGGYYLGGVSASGAGGDKTEASNGGDDYWVIKIDANGNKLADKRYGGSGNDTNSDGSTLTSTNDYGYVIGGYSDSGLNGDKTQTSQGSSDFWVAKFNDIESLPNSTFCNSPNVLLKASNCNGTINWSTGATTLSITVTPNTTTTYTATCTENGCPSINSSVTVSVISNAKNLIGNATAGIQQASQTITSTQIVNSGINSNYRAGNSISLNNGFNAQNGSIFKAEIVGCTN